MSFHEQFFFKYFAEPVYNPSVQGYNLVNTVAYVSVLLLLAFFFVFPLLDRRGIKFDKRFAISLLPYILFGSAVRVIEPLGYVRKSINPLEAGFWFITPGVWFLTFALTILGLLVARKIKKESYHKTFALIGMLFFLPVILFVASHYGNWFFFIGTIVLIVILGQAVKFLVNALTKSKLLNDSTNFLAMQGQVIDSTATIVATTFLGFSEQHPLSAGIIGLHPAFFFIVKVGLILLILYYAERDIERENMKGFFKLFLIILGFATGMASVFKIGI